MAVPRFERFFAVTIRQAQKLEALCESKHSGALRHQQFYLQLFVSRYVFLQFLYHFCLNVTNIKHQYFFMTLWLINDSILVYMLFHLVFDIL